MIYIYEMAMPQGLYVNSFTLSVSKYATDSGLWYGALIYNWPDIKIIMKYNNDRKDQHACNRDIDQNHYQDYDRNESIIYWYDNDIDQNPWIIIPEKLT